MKSRGYWARHLAIAVVVGSMASALPVVADEGHHCCVDWSKLNLNQTQSTQIQSLEDEWAHQYSEIRPVIVEDQQKLTKLLADHNSDPVEVMALQQSIARKREQLNGLATANYLKKRQILSENQQFSLEQMIKEAVRRRQSQMYPGSHTTDVASDRIQNLMNRVRNIWPVQPER
jgi:hypothetical protein